MQAIINKLPTREQAFFLVVMLISAYSLLNAWQASQNVQSPESIRKSVVNELGGDTEALLKQMDESLQARRGAQPGSSALLVEIQTRSAIPAPATPGKRNPFASKGDEWLPLEPESLERPSFLSIPQFEPAIGVAPREGLQKRARPPAPARRIDLSGDGANPFGEEE